MNISSASSFLLLCVALLGAAGSACAAEGHIGFSGAVVEPTCAVDMPGSRAETPVAATGNHRSCGATANGPGRSYEQRVVDVAGPALATDPLLGYFASYVPAGAAAARVVVQTYD